MSKYSMNKFQKSDNARPKTSDNTHSLKINQVRQITKAPSYRRQPDYTMGLTHKPIEQDFDLNSDFDAGQLQKN